MPDDPRTQRRAAVTTSQIIACAIGMTAAIVAITAYLATARRARPARYDVRWQIPGGEFTARGLTEKEFKTLMARLKSEEEPGA